MKLWTVELLLDKHCYILHLGRGLIVSSLPCRTCDLEIYFLIRREENEHHNSISGSWIMSFLLYVVFIIFSSQIPTLEEKTSGSQCAGMQKVKVQLSTTDLHIVLISIQHNDWIGQHKSYILACKDALRLCMVPFRKGLQHSMDLLSFSRQPKTLQKHTQCTIYCHVTEVKSAGKLVQHLEAKLIRVSKEISQKIFVQTCGVPGG